MQKILTFFASIFLMHIALAQITLSVPTMGVIYADSVFPRIDILIPSDSLAAIYNDVWSDKEYSATFIFDNGNILDTVSNIGFRLRGNTSRNAAKKSFKISFNTFVSGQKYYGFEKLNLNGEHNDPCVMRSKIGWDLLRTSGLVGARANHVRLFINGIFYGVYTNVEHLDERFIQRRFGNNDGNLYKCLYPADLKYLGNDPNLYKFVENGRRAYDLKINEDIDNYYDLAHFIDVLNNTPIASLPCELEKVFNVSNYLEYMAFDVLMGHWDNYIYNKNNYYLYHNEFTGQFEYLPYDLDNTLGIDWLGKDWGTRNIYTWNPGSTSESRPLYTRLLSVQAYKDQYSYFVNKWSQQYFNTAALSPKIDALQTQIQPYIAQDSFYTLDYGYNPSTFQNAYNQAIGGHVAYGLKAYISTRRNNALSQLQQNNISPILRNPKTYKNNDSLYLQIQIEDNGNLTNTTLFANVNNTGFQNFPLFDDGQHLDNQANDGIFGTFVYLNSPSNTVSYYISATDNTNKTGRYPYCGNLTYSETSDLDAIHAQEYVLYPNPFQDKLHLKLPEKAKVRVFDVLGNLLHEGEYEKETEINTKNWLSGFYYLLFETKKEQFVKKAVKI
ncbi:MAG: CotH kinase family protein [Bacteroidia bacterium]